MRAITVDEMKKLVEGRGNRPLLINFWATWCEPCRAEFPDLIQIDDDYRARNLDLIIFSLDDMAELKTGVPQFLAEMKASQLPAYLLDVSDPGDAVSAVDPEWNGALPATFCLIERAS
ncbi:MAG: TlpA disulfide reductase family protein [Pyrinomonadaceae bacterium]